MTKIRVLVLWFSSSSSKEAKFKIQNSFAIVKLGSERIPFKFCYYFAVLLKAS